MSLPASALVAALWAIPFLFAASPAGARDAAVDPEASRLASDALLLIREGALVPMLRPTIDTLSPATDPGVESYENDAGDLFVRVVPSASATEFVLFDGSIVRQRRGDTLTLASTAGSRFTKNVVFELFVPRPTAIEKDGVAVPLVTDLGAVNLGVTWTNGLLHVKAPIGATLVVR